MFEYFAKTPAIIQKWAKNKNNEIISIDLIENALQMKSQFEGIDLSRQLLYSAADQVSIVNETRTHEQHPSKIIFKLLLLFESLFID